MPWWVDVLDIAVLAVAAVLLYGVSLVLRRRLLSRHGGTFELSHRVAGPGDEPSGAWMLGLGRYSGAELEWFRIFSLSPGPKCRWQRAQLTYEQVRQAEGPERGVLYPDHVVVTCDSPGGDLDFAMSRASLTGFQAWLESRTPGTDWNA